MRGVLSSNSMGLNSGFPEGELRKQGLVTVGILFLTAMVMVGGAMWCSADGARERAEKVGVGSFVASGGGDVGRVSEKRISKNGNEANMQTSAGE